MGLTLNVNFPAKTENGIKGIRVAKQANAVYRESFEQRKDPYGQPYYWMDGELENNDLNNGTDLDFLAENFATIVPVKYDLTDYKALENMSHWDFN
jgi:5'-nucleotidase